MQTLPSWARIGIVAAALALFVLPAADAAAQGLTGPAEGESIADWSARWIDGPVSLIATSEEQEIYAGLGNTRERLQFIRLFWERRDTQARGPRNEFLDEFEERLSYVEQEFESSREPAWQSVFGRVVILFGKPARTRREMGFPSGFSDRPPILWSYDERLPGMEPNEDMLFVFRAGQWKLMPPYPIGPTAVPEQARVIERRSNIGPAIPTDYQRSINEAIEATLVNPVDYAGIPGRVETSVQLPDAEIPFGWSTTTAPGDAGMVAVTVDLTWRLDSLIFHLVDGEFVTDMVVDVQLVDEGKVGGATSERVRINVPESEMGSRRGEIVRRSVTLEARPGKYALELLLLDQLLGYRTVYRDEVDVRRP